MNNNLSRFNFVPQLLKPPLVNRCSLLRMLVTVDVKPTMLSEKSIDILGGCLSEYLIDVVQVSVIFKFDSWSTLYARTKWAFKFSLRIDYRFQNHASHCKL